MKILGLLILSFLVFENSATAQNISDWRPENRTGVSAATGLLRSWSADKVTKGNAGPFRAHPVIHNGVLYIRHTNALMAYDIKAK